MAGTAAPGPRGDHRESNFVHRIRVDPVRGLPDPDDAGRLRLEDEKVVRKVRVFVRLPAVAHLLRELFCLVNGCGRFFSPGIF